MLDWIIQSLLLADRDWIVLPRLSINRSQFGRAEITVDFMNVFAIFQLKQLYFKHIFLLLVKSVLKIIIFILFIRLKLTMWNPCESYAISLSEEKTMKSINFILDLPWSKEVGSK